MLHKGKCCGLMLTGNKGFDMCSELQDIMLDPINDIDYLHRPGASLTSNQVKTRCHVSLSHSFIFTRYLCFFTGFGRLIRYSTGVKMSPYHTKSNGLSLTAKRSTEIFNKLCDLKKPKTHHVIGNHDHFMLKLYERYENECLKERYERGDDRTAFPLPFRVSRSIRLRDNDGTFYFTHGYQLDFLANLEPLEIESYEKLSDHMCFGFDVTGEIACNL